MLSAIVRFSLRFSGVIIALACLLVGYGLYGLSGAKYDVFPEFAPPQVGIQTEAPGLSPEQVEVLVTQPVENELNGVPGIKAMRSQSIQGLSVVTVTFASSSDIYRDRQVVSERLSALAGRLPQGVNAPAMQIRPRWPTRARKVDSPRGVCRTCVSLPRPMARKRRARSCAHASTCGRTARVRRVTVMSHAGGPGGVGMAFAWDMENTVSSARAEAMPETGR